MRQDRHTGIAAGRIARERTSDTIPTRPPRFARSYRIQSCGCNRCHGYRSSGHRIRRVRLCILGRMLAPQRPRRPHLLLHASLCHLHRQADPVPTGTRDCLGLRSLAESGPSIAKCLRKPRHQCAARCRSGRSLRVRQADRRNRELR